MEQLGENMQQRYLTMNDGNTIPQFGMGVYLVP